MFKRHATALLKHQFQNARCVFLSGARQVGKTTLARTALPHLPYVSLENPEERMLATHDPKSFLARFPKGAILDEIQRTPELLSWIQELIDNQGIKFVMTGSQNFLLHQAISQSLAGRVSIIHLPPLSQAEIRKATLPDPLALMQGQSKGFSTGESWSAVLRGGYPEPCSNPKRAKTWHSDYLQTYVERDVRQILQVRDLAAFQRFLALCAGRTGQVLNISSIASDTGISESATRQWLSVLESSGIIYLLRPYHKNFNKQVIKSPKLHFCDTGLACHLLRIKDVKTLSIHPLAGSLFETWAIQELRKHWLNAGEVAPIYWWRDNHGLEVDLLIELPEGFWPIEIKSGKTLHPDLWKNMIRWCQTAGLPETQGSLIYGGKEHLKIQGVQTVSWAAL